MQTIILAGGEGKRVFPLAANRPKPMFKLLGKPLIHHVIDTLKEAGLKDYVVVVGHRGEQIKDYLKDQGVELPPGVSIPTPSNEETIKKIPPDIVVSTGDGKTSFGGEGNFSDPKQLEYGSENTEMHYTWHMTRRKIK